MVDQRLKELRGTGRRDFLRWSATVAACLGLERARFLNVLNDSAGSAAADTAACATTMRHIHLFDGNGGLSNWTQIFPFPKVIGSTNAKYSHYALGKGIPTKDGEFDRPFTYAPDSPWQNQKWKITAFLAGNNETHTATPNSAASLGNNSLLASSAAIQQANPTLLPVLTLNNINIGTAPGAPTSTMAQRAKDLVELFNSAASNALLKAPANGPLSEAYYKAFLGLNASAGQKTVAKGYSTGKISMNLLAKNLASQLTPTTADQQLFGIAANTPGAVKEMANAMITTVKAFSLGLTSMLTMNAFRDDPHGLFSGGDNAAKAKAEAMGKLLNGLFAMTQALQDPSCSAKTLADSMVFSISGDTFKQPFNRNGWGDGSPQSTNALFVMGNGYLKTGWHGDMDPGGAKGWDPSTGEVNGSYQGQGTALGQAAAAAVCYAVSKGDMRRVRDFYNGPAIDGVVNINVTG